MIRFACLLYVLLLPAVACADRVALVIGNANYSNVAQLENPENDSREVTHALQRQGFQVVQRDNLDRNTFFDALREFRTLADKSDIALVYFAGHGIEIGGVNYLMPVDSVLEDERDASVEMIQLEVVLRQISGARSMKMVVLDACRNNPFVARMKRLNGGRNVRAGLGDNVVSQADTLIAYAAAAGAVTPDGEAGGNSPFTEAFLKVIDGPPMDVRRFFGAIADEMRKTVPGAEPFVYTSLGGQEFVINPNNATPEPAKAVEPPEPDPTQEQTDAPTAADAERLAAFAAALMVDYLEADRQSSLDVWNDFLIKYEAMNYHQLYSRALEKRDSLVALDAGTTQTAQRDPPAQVERRSDVTKQAIATEPEPDPVQEEPQIGEEQLALLDPADVAPEPPAEAEPDRALLDLPEDKKQAAVEIQTLLADRNCYRGAIDGILGRNSKRGLDQLQRKLQTDLAAGTRSSLEELHEVILTLRANPEVTCPKTKTTQSTVRRTPSSSPVRRTTRPAPAPTVQPKPAPAPKPAPVQKTDQNCRQC